jgi:DNA polymerase-3 subunit gamma/tau
MELDAASHNSVEDIRDMRMSVTTVALSAGSRRVYILDEAHMLSKAAGNALLKTLEEPPEHVVFVLATTEPYKLLDTIRSRTQRFDFHPVAVEPLAAHLARIADAEGYKFEPSALLSVARHSGGSARDALSLMEQVAALGAGTVDLIGVRRTLGTADAEVYSRLADAIAASDARSALELVAELASRGVDLRRFVGEAIGFFRGVFLAHYAPNLAEVADEPVEVLETWKKAAGRIGSSDVLRAVDVLGEALIRVREGREERLMVELAMIRLTRPETASDPEALAARIERLERRPESRVPSPESRPGTPDSRGASAESRAPSPKSRVPSTESRVSSTESQVPSSDQRLTTPGTGASSNEIRASSQPANREKRNSPVVTVDRFNEIWPALFGGLRQVLGARRWALFREATPGGIEGSKLILFVAQDFHLEGLQRDAAVMALVATQASDLIGTPVTVEFRKTTNDGTSAATETFELDKDRLFEAPLETTDPTALLERELGATLVEEIKNE